MARIPESLYEKLRSEGHISDAEHTELHNQADDNEDEGVTGATPESQSVEGHEAASLSSAQDISADAVRADLLSRAAAFEAQGDFRAAGVLKSQAAHAADSTLAPAPMATAPVAGSGAVPLAEQIATAEESGEWQKAMALKTSLLLKGAE